jgi:glycosyltransferase involved in cell wall biosynthesis
VFARAEGSEEVAARGDVSKSGGRVTSSTKLLHIAAWIRTTGGVETLLARHATRDEEQGFGAKQIALFDKELADGRDDYLTQAFSWRSTPRAMRRAMKVALAPQAGRVVLWHNGWGLPWFAGVDGSSRRIVCLWDSVAHFGPWLAKVAPLVDGVICMSEAAARDVARLLNFPDERRVVLRVPISSAATAGLVRSQKREWVIGCGGRLVRAQKRWERLVPFVEELRRLEITYRIEVVSDGPLRPWLERKFGLDPAVQFLGWQNSADYRRRIQGWDAAVFFSDHEGGPIVLLEAMAAGVLPVYPQMGGSLGDDYVPRVDRRCYYPAGDAKAAARALRDVLSVPPAEMESLRQRARELVAPHTGESYDEAFAAFVRRIVDMPRISALPSGGRRAHWFDHVPLGFLTRCFKKTLWQ